MSQFGSIIQQIQELSDNAYSAKTIAVIIKRETGVVLSEEYINEVIDEYEAT